MRQTMAHIPHDHFCIPAAAFGLAGFRSWSVSCRFPPTGRIDFLAGDLEVDMSPEDLYTHGAVKAEIGAVLQDLIAHAGLGCVFIDRARVSSLEGDLSVEPDVVALLWESIDRGRAREIPSASGQAGRYIEIEGAPELWLCDVRGRKLQLDVYALAGARYRLLPPESDGSVFSPLLQRQIEVTRSAARPNRWTYRLVHRERNA